MTPIEIKIGDQVLSAVLNDTPTARSVLAALPFESTVITWGEEIYFQLPVYVPLEPDAQAEVDVGDLAYWPSMPAFCIFFGATPVSLHGEPRAASPVNIFGKLLYLDLPILKSIRDGDRVSVSTGEFSASDHSEE